MKTQEEEREAQEKRGARGTVEIQEDPHAEPKHRHNRKTGATSEAKEP